MSDRTEIAMTAPREATPTHAGRRSTSRALVGIAAVAGAIALGRTVGGYVPEFARWVESLGAWGPIAFVAGYVVACVAFIPGVVLTLAAGAIFGWIGVVYVFVGAGLGASAAFLIARYVARSAVERRLEGNPRFAAIDRAIGRDGRKIVTLLRLSPVFPFNLLNYALGLTQVRFRDYVIAMVGILPGTLLYVYAGKLLGDVAVLAGGAAPPKGTAYYAVLGLGLVATIGVTTIVTRTARRALEEATDGTEPPAR
jgi:uncharacterized membrane protein YdjX (TVP38/TMEM64 family)